MVLVKVEFRTSTGTAEVAFEIQVVQPRPCSGIQCIHSMGAAALVFGSANGTAKLVFAASSGAAEIVFRSSSGTAEVVLKGSSDAAKSS